MKTVEFRQDICQQNSLLVVRSCDSFLQHEQVEIQYENSPMLRTTSWLLAFFFTEMVAFSQMFAKKTFQVKHLVDIVTRF